MVDMNEEGGTDARVQVEIGGRTYTLRGSRNPDSVRDLAAYVDGKMSEISRRTSTADTTRLAILAALNIADELFRKEPGPGPRREDPAVACGHEARDGDLCRMLDAALAD